MAALPVLALLVLLLAWGGPPAAGQKRKEVRHRREHPPPPGCPRLRCRPRQGRARRRRVSAVAGLR